MSTPAFDETVAFDPPPVLAGDGFPTEDDLVGSRLGQYRIGQVIGRGTMGRVYQAEHDGLARTSALKVLSPGLMRRQPRTLERFQAEARAVAALVHPNIVTIHNLGADRGYHFIEMELIPGGTSLKEELVRDGAFEPAVATQLVRQVALGLDAAHASGLAHRDVKPSNVLLTPDGRAKLADFGLVQRLDGRDGFGGDLAGTPTFMAPELFQGSPAGPATDLYAVGVMIYYLLTARLPYSSDRIDRIVRMHRRAAVPDPRSVVPEIPEDLARIVMRLLAKAPAERPASAGVLAEELKNVLGHVQDTESFIRQAIEGMGGVIQGARERFRVILPVGTERIQEVYLESHRNKQGVRQLAIYSVCGPADPRYYEFALRFNDEFPQGGMSIRQVNGTPMFVITRSVPQVKTTVTEIRQSIKDIARWGDWVEQRMGHLDLF